LAGYNLISMAIEKIRWVKVSESLEEVSFGPNNLAEVMADDKQVCIGKYKEELFAFAAKCPHASGLLAEGFIDAVGNVVCPLHRYKFCMKNGRNVSGEGYYLKHWPVEVREEGVYVGLESKSFLGLF
jgi:3-phenylpropionate/trans-cinnamate dioxygenase ferredoxin subunit